MLAIGILQGILLAIFLGLLGLVAAAKSRSTAVLGRVPGGATCRSLEYYPDGETFPGLLIVRCDGSLFFANTPEFVDELRSVQLCGTQEIAHAGTATQCTC